MSFVFHLLCCSFSHFQVSIAHLIDPPFVLLLSPALEQGVHDHSLGPNRTRGVPVKRVERSVKCMLNLGCGMLSSLGWRAKKSRTPKDQTTTINSFCVPSQRAKQNQLGTNYDFLRALWLG